MIQPPRGRGLAAGGGSAGGVAMATLAGKVPSTPGRAPGGGGGSASAAGTAAAVRAGSVRTGSGRAVSARAASFRVVSLFAVSLLADSLGRGRPANGAVAADATVVLPFTLKVFTATGWIGSLDPGAARCVAADVAGRSR